jgi:hypothetical protein
MADYHCLIQHCAGRLWRRCRREPDLLGQVERLCGLDIGLIQARPGAASDLIDRERSRLRSPGPGGSATRVRLGGARRAFAGSWFHQYS